MKNTGKDLVTKDKVYNKLLLVLVVFSMIPVFFVSKTFFLGFAQIKDKNEKEIKKSFFPDEPIEIVNAGNNKKLVKLGEKFTQNSDWLKGFTVEIKNKSDKAITYVRLELDFPETISSGNVMTFPLSYGIRPMLSKTSEKVEAVQSGKSVKFSLNEKNFETLKTFIERRHLLDNLSQVSIRVVFVLFEDGTGWSTGVLVRPDPNNPKKFIPVNSKELGGN